MSNNFTVVTPNYNMGEYLADTIESVLRNLQPGDEYYVVDGGSSDDSLAVIKRYADRLTGWISEKDEGYADALAKGFAKSTAQYQCWINSGDLLLNGALDKAREHLDGSKADMIFGDDFYIDDRDAVLGFSSGGCDNLRKAMLYGDWTPLQDACFWRSDLYRRVGGLDTSLRNAADYDLFARFSVAGEARYVSTTFSAFRRHDEQRSIAHRGAYKDEKENVADAIDSKLERWVYFQTPVPTPIFHFSTLESSRAATTLGSPLLAWQEYPYVASRILREFISVELCITTEEKREHLNMTSFIRRATRRILGSIKQAFKLAPQFYLLKKEGRKTGRFSFRLTDAKPCLADATATTGFDRHYIFHTAWAARILAKTLPVEHIDISSSLYFIGTVSAFVPIRFLDYRPANLGLSGVREEASDIRSLPFSANSIASLSCMHVVEHIGLGRYGDPLDYNGDLAACDELKRVLAPGGQLLFVVPIAAQPYIAFNAHRVYSHSQIKQMFDGFVLEEFSLIPDKAEDGGLISFPDEELLARQRYGCGCFLFRKPSVPNQNGGDGR